MEICQLEYFLAVKNAGSFTRAAEHLYVSQPAVTSAIRSLESELGITLFDRSQGKASLTAEGRIFSAHVEEIMKGVVTTICDMDAMKSLSSGTLPVTAIRPFPHRPLPFGPSGHRVPRAGRTGRGGRRPPGRSLPPSRQGKGNLQTTCERT